MKEIAEIELAIQGGTEKIEQLGMWTPCCPSNFRLNECTLGESGKVDESMREMAAIEALKAEKSEKEVCALSCQRVITNDSTARTATTHGYLRSFWAPETPRV